MKAYKGLCFGVFLLLPVVILAQNDENEATATVNGTDATADSISIDASITVPEVTCTAKLCVSVCSSKGFKQSSCVKLALGYGCVCGDNSCTEQQCATKCHARGFKISRCVKDQSGYSCLCAKS